MSGAARQTRWWDLGPGQLLTAVLVLCAGIAIADDASSVIGIAVALTVAVALSRHGSALARAVRYRAARAHPRGSRLRGAYRRNFMPNEAGRPRRPRAPGIAALAA